MFKSLSETIDIVCTIDKNYVQHCAVMLCSLSRNNPGIDFNVFIITPGLSKHLENKLLLFLRKLRFTVSFVTIDKSKLANAPVYGHVSLATYFRLLIPSLLDSSIKKVLFLDSDMIIRREISSFWRLDISNYAHAAVENSGLDPVYPQKLGIDPGNSYFNAGVLLINLEAWRDKNVQTEGIDFMDRYPDRIVFWDQDVLNYLLQGSWLKVTPRWNAQEVFFKDYTSDELGITAQEHEEIKSNPSIVHFTGSGSCKPWHYQCNHPFRQDYYTYLAQTPWRNARPTGKPSLISRAKQNVKYLVKGVHFLFNAEVQKK
jgi:lipopolysaccharide biosynthesis glycosyltransferase